VEVIINIIISDTFEIGSTHAEIIVCAVGIFNQYLINLHKE